MGLLDITRAGEDAGIRQLLARLDDLETQLRQVAAASAGNQSQVNFLANQTVSAEAAPGAVTTITTNPATVAVADTWLPFSAAADATVTLTTSSTGRVAVQCGGYIYVASANYPIARGFIGIEILAANGVTVVRAPLNGDGNLTAVWGANDSIVNANSGHRHEWLLTPSTQYTFRCRRGYSVAAGSAGAVATTSFQGTALTVEKLGM